MFSTRPARTTSRQRCEVVHPDRVPLTERKSSDEEVGSFTSGRLFRNRQQARLTLSCRAKEPARLKLLLRSLGALQPKLVIANANQITHHLPNDRKIRVTQHEATRECSRHTAVADQDATDAKGDIRKAKGKLAFEAPSEQQAKRKDCKRSRYCDNERLECEPMKVDAPNQLDER